MLPSFEQRHASSLLGRITIASAHRYHGNGNLRDSSTLASGNDPVGQTPFVARLSRGSASSRGTLWRSGAELAEAYFSGNREDSDDPFFDAVQQDRFAAERFIWIVLAFSASSSIAVCASRAVFLPMVWHQAAACKTPLRWWLVVHCVFQLVQIPAQIVFLWKVGRADVDDLEVCVSSFTASPAWRRCRNTWRLANAWLILGVMWMVNADDTARRTEVYNLVLGAMGQAVARQLVAFVSYRLLLSGSESEGRPIPPEVNGAEPEQISALPIVRFQGKRAMDEGASCAATVSCAICLSDYHQKELLRRLPCGHHFHRSCADHWLCRSKRCPLCMQAIDMKK